MALSMRRIFSVLAAMAIMAAMVAASAMPASAQAGCQDFGLVIAAEAPHGELASEHAPLNDDVVAIKAGTC